MGRYFHLALLLVTVLYGVNSVWFNNVYDADEHCGGDTSWRYYEGQCHRTTYSSGTWDNVRKECLSYGGDLAVLDSRQMLRHFQRMWGNINYWIGLRRYSREYGKYGYQWTNGKKYTQIYHRFSGTEPNTDSYDCAYYHSYVFYDSDCNTARHGICQIPAMKRWRGGECVLQENTRSRITYSIRDSLHPVRDSQECSKICTQDQAYFSFFTIAGECMCTNEAPLSGNCTEGENPNTVQVTETFYPSEEPLTISSLNYTCENNMVYYNGKCYWWETGNREQFFHIKHAKETFGPTTNIVRIETLGEDRWIDEVLLATWNQLDLWYGLYLYIGGADTRLVCDEGWLAYDGACFKREDTARTWDEQRAFCQNLREGADMVWYEQSPDQTIMKELYEDWASVNHVVYMGIYEKDLNQRNWVYPMWGDRTGHRPWAANEGSHNGQQCAIAQSVYSFAIYDIPCTAEYKTVCRYNPPGVGGMRDSSGQYEWVWLEDGTSINHTYNHFGYNQPDQGTVQCLFKWDDLLWHDAGCRSSKNAIYEAPAILADVQYFGEGIYELFRPVEVKLNYNPGVSSRTSVLFNEMRQQRFDWDKSFESFVGYPLEIGTNVITYETTNFVSESYNGSIVYEAILPVKKVLITCPEKGLIENPTECSVSSAGIAQEGTVMFFDGSTQEVFLDDSTVYRVGPNMDGWTSPSNWDPSTSRAWAMFGSRFDHAGLVLAIDFDVTQIGEVMFIVWRPQCAEGKVYCSKSQNCHDIDYQRDVCETVGHWNATTCGSNTWSLALRQCVDTNGNPVAQTPLHHGHYTIHSSMKNVGSVTVKTVRHGRQLYYLNEDEQIEVLPGDILGFRGLGARIAWRNPTGQARTSYATGTDFTVWPQNTIGSTVDEFMINAYVARYASTAIQAVFPDVGYQNITFFSTNDYTEFAQIDYTQIEMQSRINLSYIDASEYATRDSDHIFKVTEHLGSHATYSWDFGDGTTATTDIMNITHVYDTLGTFTVRLHTYNDLTEFFDEMTVLVQGAIDEATFAANNLESVYLVMSSYEICSVDGNSINYSMTMNHSGVPTQESFELSPNSCESGWTSANDESCYLRTSQTFSWADAATACEDTYHRSYPAYYGSNVEANAIVTDVATWGAYKINDDGVLEDLYGHLIPDSAWRDWLDANAVQPGKCVSFLTVSSTNKWVVSECADNKLVVCMYKPSCQTFHIQIPNPGVYEVNLTVQNYISRFDWSGIQYVVTEIEGLLAPPIPSVRHGDDTVILFSTTSGSLVTFDCFAGPDDSYPRCQNHFFDESITGGNSTGYIISEVSEYQTTHDHQYLIRLSNLLATVEYVFDFTVMYEIQNVELVSDVPCATTLEQTVTWTLTAEFGTHMTVNYTFKDQTTPDTDDSIYVDQLTAAGGETKELTHDYPYEGTYELEIILSNDINSMTVATTILIENPIRGYKVVTDEPASLFPDALASVAYTLIFDPTYEQNGEPHRLPTDVMQSYYYGGPDCTVTTTEASTTPFYNYTTGDMNATTASSTEASSTQISTDSTATVRYTSADGESGSFLLTTPDMWVRDDGSPCPMAAHSEMVNVSTSWNDTDLWYYGSYGTYHFVANFSNCVDEKTIEFDIDVDHPVLNLVSDAGNAEPGVKWNSSTNLTMLIDWGSRINITWHFNDSNPDEHTVYDRFDLNQVEHLWNVVGDSYPKIITENTVGVVTQTIGPLFIQYELFDALYFETTETQFLDHPSYSKEVEFVMYLRSDYATMMPTNVTADIKFGDKDPDGTLHTSLDNYLPDEAQFNSILDKDNGDRHVWTFSHVYTYGDSYTVNIDLYNLVSSLSISFEFELIEQLIDLHQHALVLNDVTLHISPGDFDTDQHIAQWFSNETHQYTSKQLRQMLEMWIQVNNNVQTTTPPSTDGSSTAGTTASPESTVDQSDSSSTMPPTAEAATTTVPPTVFGGTSRGAWWYANPPLTIKELEQVLQQISDLGLEDRIQFDENAYDDYILQRMFANNQSTVLEHVRPGFKETQYGDTISSYRLEEPFVVYANFSRGTHLTYEWSWGDGKRDVTDQAMFTHRFPAPGEYEVSVKVTNKNNWMTYATRINIQRSVSNLAMEGYDIVTFNYTNSWTIDLGTIGTDACYMVDFKDTSELAANRYMFFGNKAECLNYFPMEMAIWPLRIISKTMEQLDDIMAHNGFVREEASFIFMALGMFRVQLIGINRVSSVTITKYIAVTQGPCFPSLVNVALENPCLSPEMCSDEGEKMVYKSQNLTVASYVKHDCEITQMAWFTWTVYRVDDNGDETEMNDYLKSKNTELISMTLRKLSIASRVLDYGRYRLNLNVTMYGEDIFALDDVYIHIVKTPLVVYLNEISSTNQYVRKQFNTNYTMDALTYSEDPDDPESKDGFEFTWLCRRSCESYPEMDENYNIVSNMTSDCEAYNMSYIPNLDESFDGGCFFEDYFRQSGKLTDSKSGVFIAQLGLSYEWDVLYFEIHVKKDTRSAIIKQSITVTQGAPPDIDANLCVSNCKDKVNYEEIYSMEAKIRTRGIYVYKWSLWRGIRDDLYHGQTEEIEESEWQNNAPADNPNKAMVPTGSRTASFALEPNFFAYSDINYYFFVVIKAYRSGGDPQNYGMVVMPFQVNEPPLTGNCSVFPLNGTAVSTMFNIECTEFYDQHQPVLYQLGYRAVGSASPKIAFGDYRPTATQPGDGIPVSQGIESEGYQVEMFVRAKDSIGGTVLSEPIVITVIPAPAENLLSAMTDLDSLASSGDNQAALALIGAIAGGMNNQQAETEVVDLESMTEAERAEYEAQQAQLAQEALDAARERREQLLLIAVSLVVTDMDTLNSVASTASSVVTLPAEMSATAINSSALVALNGIAVLNGTRGRDASEMNEVITNVASTTCGSMSAFAYHLSNDQSEDPNGQHSDSSEVMNLLVQSMSSMGSVADRTKVPGEGDTVLVTEQCVLNQLKKYAEQVEDGQVASGGDAVNGAYLPPGRQLLGTGNDSATVLSVTSNVYGNKNLPFIEVGMSTNPNSTNTGLSGALLQMFLKDENSDFLDLNNTDIPESEREKIHIFIKIDMSLVPPPVKVVTYAAQYGTPLKEHHRVEVRPLSSMQLDLKRTTKPTNTSTTTMLPQTQTTGNFNSTTMANLGRRKRQAATTPTGSTLDPMLSTFNDTGGIDFDELNLVWVIYFRANAVPTATSYDFNCTLPILYYDMNENTTLAIGGTIWNSVCDDLWAVDPNATCERSSMNRRLYPKDRSIVEFPDDRCFIPDTWINSDSDVNIYTAVSYFYMNITNFTMANLTEKDIQEGRFPAYDIVDIPEEFVEEVYYEMEVFSATCKYWHPFYQIYTTDGCEVGPLTEKNATHCICNYLTPPIPEDDGTDEEYFVKLEKAQNTPGISFGSGISIPMNTIDLSNSAFNNLGDNPLIFTVMVSIMCLYLCACIWASSQDRKDALKSGVSPLLDNDPRDKYLYEVTVWTGTRTGSGTSAKVSMVFSGEEDETQPRLIYDDKRPVLRNGSVDSFVMAVPRCLGSMSHVRVWHDNSGNSPGWFFSRMQLVDMKTLEKYYFILDRWLSAGEDDGIIDRIVPLAGKDELTGFSHIFFTKARKDLMDGHIWFSVFAKPHKSSFTRVQRLTCCICLLFACMVANIWLYQGDEEKEGGTHIRIGPIELTLEEMLTGIMSSLVAFPINILIVLLFKYTDSVPYNWRRKCCAPCRNCCKKKEHNLTNELLAQAEFLDTGDDSKRMMMNTSRASFASLSNFNDECYHNQGVSDEVKKRNKKFRLPWGFLFVNYFLCLCVCGVSFWITVEFGGTFGPKKSAEWMASFAASIAESIFMSQPIKVLGLALFWALVIKKPTGEDDHDPGLEQGEEYLHKHEKSASKITAKHRKQFNKFKAIPQPPTEEYLSAARALRMKEVKMMEVIREVILYILYIYLLMMVSVGNRDPSSHSLYSSLYSEFHDAAYVDDGVAFNEVSDYGSFWGYMNDTLIPSIWPDEWYDGAIRDTQFTADRQMYRVGPPRIRQLRMLEEECAMPMYKYARSCGPSYNLFGEDEQNYYPGWIPVTNESASTYNGPYQGWHWQSGLDLDGFPFSGQIATYGGGGYNIELGRSKSKAQSVINELYDNNWLSISTRAIVVEFNLYNPNINLFAIASLTFEFLPTGGILPVYKMNIIRLDRYIGTYMITVMIAELLTSIYFIYFTVKTIQAIVKLKKAYFKSFWNTMAVGEVLLYLTLAVMFVYRAVLAKATRDEFLASPDKFVSFNFASTWEEIYGYMLSFIIFFAIVKILKLLRFNKRMNMIGMTLMYIGKPLASFGLALGVAFLAFAQMAYMIFAKLLYEFSTFAKASFTLITLMLNKFDYKALEDADRLFAPIVFFSFVVLISWTLLSFMITIICDGFAQVQEDLAQKENQYEILEFMVSKFKGLIGVGTGPALPPMNTDPDSMATGNHDELMDRLQDMEEMFRDFAVDESKGEESLVQKYEKEIIAARRAARNKTIYNTE